MDTNDFVYFNNYGIIPSIQPTHAISDGDWAGKRIGKERMKGAYAYKTLLDYVAFFVLGTDFPIEDINPLRTFYAAVFSKEMDGKPVDGYQPEQALPTAPPPAGRSGARAPGSPPSAGRTTRSATASHY